MIKSIAIASYKEDAWKKISSKMPKAELGCYYTYLLQHNILLYTTEVPLQRDKS